VTRTPAKSAGAAVALTLVESLQQRLVAGLASVGHTVGIPTVLEPAQWLRDGGRHGGGERYGIGDHALFNRASVNVSQVHYDDDPARRLASATALSTIVHPDNPHGPSVHMHFSWTEMRDNGGYWRMMADLNPSIEDADATQAFAAALQEAAGDCYEEGRAQGDRYFFIPALDRHRGATHFYLEGYSTPDPHADAALARRVGEAAIDQYCAILQAAVTAHPTPTEAERQQQLAYHTLYLLQVLTLDRGTTSGLMIHSDNDVGVLGSLPRQVDRALLASWRDRQSPPQDSLVDGLVAVLVDASPSPVTVETKRALADVVRAHYTEHPEALAYQASGNSTPPTVANHQ